MLDNPEDTFKKANYAPIWTAEPGQDQGRLPLNCTVIPHESRTWEPWFRATLKNGSTVLTTADLFMIRQNICLNVATDPRTQFSPPTTMDAVARSVDKVRGETLQRLGVHSPSSPLLQLTMADAAYAWVKSQRHYGQEMKDKYFFGEGYKGVKFIGHTRDGKPRGKGIWPSPNDFTSEDLSESCQEATPNMVSLLRSIFKINNLEAKVGGLSVSWYHPNPEGHNITGVHLNISDESCANLYYDPTPSPVRSGYPFSPFEIPNFFSFSGSLDKVSLECLANRVGLDRWGDEPQLMGMRPTRTTDGRFPLGENWSDKFNLGNFAPFKDGRNGRSGVGDGACI